MIKSYFVSAYRNIIKNKFYSALNIFGTAIGITCAILILWVLISNLISWPTAYYLMDNWLHGFANRMDFGLSPFVPATVVPFIVSLLVTLIIALITISSLSVKAARVNPIETLSRE